MVIVVMCASVCLFVHPSIILDCGQQYIPQPHFTCHTLIPMYWINGIYKNSQFQIYLGKNSFLGLKWKNRCHEVFFKKYARYDICLLAYVRVYSGLEITNKKIHTSVIFLYISHICIHNLSRWLTFWIYLTVPTHTNVLDNSCTEKSYRMLHNAGVDNCHGNTCCPLGDHVSNINL